MKLRRLRIDRLPGIDEPFALEELGDGFNVIVGPNGVGKSSLCRATRSLLWDTQASDGYVAVRALFDHDGEAWRVEREGSRVGWQRDGSDEPAPPLPPQHLDGCFFLLLRDLLDASLGAGSELAAQIRRQMSGGFDLDRAATDAFGSVGPRHGRREQRDLGTADRELRRSSNDQAQLSRREQQLESLDPERSAAESAQRRLAHFERALELEGLREESVQLDAELSELPGALSKLTGDELAQLDQRASELEGKREQRSGSQTEIARAEKAIADTRLESALDAAELATWRARADQLSALEARFEQALQESQERAQAVGTARRAVGLMDSEPAPSLDLSGDSELFSFLREATEADHGRNAATQRLKLLESRDSAHEDPEPLERLQPAAGALRAWLRAPDPEAPSAFSGAKRRWLLPSVIVALVVAGSVLGLMIHPGFALLAGVGLGLTLALWITRSNPSIRYAREAAQRDFPLGIDPPNPWTVRAATQRLREIEGRIAELEAAAQRRRDRGVERADIENQLETLAEQGSELERRRRALASRLSLESIPPDAELVDMARALDQLRQSDRAASQADQRVKTIRKEHTARLGEVAGFLAQHGEAEPTDAASTRAGLDQLSARDHALRRARDAESNARDGIQALDRDIARIETIVAAIYERAEVESGDRVALTRLADHLDRYHELQRRREVLARSIRLSVESLSKAGEEALTRAPREDIEAERQQLEERVERLESLRDKIAQIRAEVKQAREGHSLEEAISRREGARRRLEERREEALRAAAGRLLLEAVKREHETHQMPRVLERARELFASFTHHAYELRVAASSEDSFIAIETHSGSPRRPLELSDGTRTQLLLAARLAFADEAERGNPLPLFLDEALDQSDPLRFQAIVRSLGRMVEDEGRQIFYLTNDPVDVERIRSALSEEGCAPARAIDLGAIRKQARSLSDPGALRVDPLPPVPAPNGATPEAYAVLLQVPPLDPRRGSAAQHLIYLLWEDLDLLHRLLESQIEDVGSWRFLSRKKAALAQRIVDGNGLGAQLDSRAQLLDAFCQLWSEGRGRPIDRDAIERGGIRERYLDDVAQIAAELGGSGSRLIEVLHTRRDPRLQGFRSKTADAFEAVLTEEGYLDARPILAESDLHTQLLATPAAAHLPEPVVTELSHRWWGLCGSRSATESRLAR